MDKFRNIEKSIRKIPREDVARRIDAIKIICTYQSCPYYMECAGIAK